MCRIIGSLLSLTSLVAILSGNSAMGQASLEDPEVCLTEKCNAGGSLLQTASDRRLPRTTGAQEWPIAHRGISPARKAHMCTTDERPKAVSEDRHNKSSQQSANKKHTKPSLSEVEEAVATSVKIIDLKGLNKQMADVNSAFLIVFYVEWCGHCKRFVMQKNAPLEQVSKALESENGPPVYKFLMTEGVEEPPEEYFEILGYPTIYLKKKGTKMPVEYPHNYEGSEGLKQLKEWTLHNFERR